MPQQLYSFVCEGQTYRLLIPADDYCTARRTVDLYCKSHRTMPQNWDLEGICGTLAPGIFTMPTPILQTNKEK
jgi:hypothetical protein